MLEVKNLQVRFRKKQILHDIDLSIEKGKILAVVGQSGSGKTTLLKAINRIVEEEGGKLSGEMRLFGRDLMRMDKEELRRRIGMVFQQPIAFPGSIERNLAYVLQYHRNLSRKELQEQIVLRLAQVRLYEEVQGHLKHSAQTLSGGQKQRLAIARSLCADPDLLLLDEPCSALDMKNTLAIEELLLSLRKEYGFVIVTHNLAQAKRIADSIVFMDEGRVLEVTEKEAFFTQPKTQPAREQIAYLA